MKIITGVIIFLVVLILPIACSEDEETMTQPVHKEASDLPKVISSEPLTHQMLSDLGMHPSSRFAKFPKEYNVDAAVRSRYEGYKELEFVYLPKANNDKVSTVNIYANEKLVEELSYDLTVTDTTITADFGNGNKLIYVRDGDYIIGVYFEEGPTPTNAKAPKDVFNSYIQCEDAISQQASDKICGGCGAGKIAWRLACGVFRPCAGAAVVACTAYVISLWWDGKYGYGGDDIQNN